MQTSGVQELACDEKADIPYTDIDLTVPTAFIMGSEGKGISSELLRLSDKQVKIPLMGKIESFNVSVTSGIVMFEALRQRMVNAKAK
jgi:23S rRNA (guanosine2251-2'-O)-methyltransferase